MPDNGCDAACVKIIINGGFMAALAPQVAERWHENESMRESATQLATAARCFIAMATARGLSVTSSDSFDGCEQGSMLVHWLTVGLGEHVIDAPRLMKGWAYELWQHVADLAAGKTLA